MLKIGLLTAVADDDGGFVDAMELTDLAGDLRLDYVDYHTRKGLGSTDREYLRSLKYKAVKRGLSIGHLTTAESFMGPPERIERLLKEAKVGIDAAVFLGAPLMRIIVGPPTAEDRDPDQTWATTVRCFQTLADYAAERAIVIGICNHNYGTGRPRGDDIVRAYRDIHRENLTVIMDTGQWWPNFNTGHGDFQPNELAYGYMEQVAPYTSSVAAKVYDIESGREEFVDYRRVFGILKAANFNGGVSIFYKKTYTNVGYAEGIRMAAEYLRNLAAEIGI